MTYPEKYKYWEMLSDYDMDTARDMAVCQRWMYVATICYTSLERLLKGLIVYRTRKEAPKSDNLVFLMTKLAGNKTFTETEDGQRFLEEKSEYFDLMADVTFYHINDYPFSYQKVTDRFIGEDTAMEVLNDAVKVSGWLKTFAPSEDKENIE